MGEIIIFPVQIIPYLVFKTGFGELRFKKIVKKDILIRGQEMKEIFHFLIE